LRSVKSVLLLIDESATTEVINGFTLTY
jgi:hypothetical protein